jgi:hypothetical protein
MAYAQLGNLGIFYYHSPPHPEMELAIIVVDPNLILADERLIHLKK